MRLRGQERLNFFEDCHHLLQGCPVGLKVFLEDLGKLVIALLLQLIALLLPGKTKLLDLCSTYKAVI